ncbi:MAG: AIR synthase-related protein [Candidatus Micrarchaeota archaeon]
MATYSESGVNIELGDDASKVMYNAARITWENRKGKFGEIVIPFDDFSGLRAIDVSSLPKGTMMSVNFDGIGTKAEIAERLNKHDTMAFDLFAMVCDDAVVRGGEPVLVGSILDVNKLDLNVVKQLAKGYVNAAKEANVAVINGEIAELGSRVGGFGGHAYNWGAAVIWFAEKKNMFTGKEIKVGDKLVSFKEKGFRSNGFSLLRKIMEDKWDNKTLLEALEPSKIYTKAVLEMLGKLHGVAHITGGGIPGKLGRMLKPSGLGARLDNLFGPCRLMNHCMDVGNVPINEAYKTWNMGNGMIVATDQPDSIIRIAKKHGIEAKVSGEVVKEKGIQIYENFAELDSVIHKF